MAERRDREQTPEFPDRYRNQAGIEGTISDYEARTGVKQLRVRGLEAVRVCATLFGANLRAVLSREKGKFRPRGKRRLPLIFCLRLLSS